MTAHAPRPPTPAHDIHIDTDSLRHPRRPSSQSPTMPDESFLPSSSAIAPAADAHKPCITLDALQDIQSAAPARQAPRAQDQTQIVPPMRLPGPAGRIAHVQGQEGRAGALAKHPLLASSHDAPRYQPWRPRSRFIHPRDAFGFSKARRGGAADADDGVDDNDDHYDDDDLYEDDDEEDGYVYPTPALPPWTSPASADTDLELEADDESSGSGSTASSRTGSIMSISSRKGSVTSSASSFIVSLSPECALRDESGMGPVDGGEDEASIGGKESPDDRTRREGDDGRGLDLNLLYHPRAHALRDRPRVRFLETPGAYSGNNNFLDADDDELSPLSPLGPFTLGTGDIYRYSKYDWPYQDPSSAYTHDYPTTQAYPAIHDYPTTQGHSSNPDFPTTRFSLTAEDRDERIYALEHKLEDDRLYPPHPAADHIYTPQPEGDRIHQPQSKDDRIHLYGDDKPGYVKEAGNLADAQKDSTCAVLLGAPPLPQCYNLNRNRNATCPSPSSSSETATDRTPRATPPPHEQAGARSVSVAYHKGFLTEPAMTPAKKLDTTDHTRELWPSSRHTSTVSGLVDDAYLPRLPHLELPSEETHSIFDSSFRWDSDSGETNYVTCSLNEPHQESSSKPPVRDQAVLSSPSSSSSSLLPDLYSCAKLGTLCDTWSSRPSHTAADSDTHRRTYAPWISSSSRNPEWTLFPADGTDTELPMTPSRRRSMDLPLLSEDVFGLCTRDDASRKSGDDKRSGRLCLSSEGETAGDKGIRKRERGHGQEYDKHGRGCEEGHDHEYGRDHEQPQDIDLGSPRYRSLPGADIDDDFLPRDLAPKNYVPDPTSVVRSSPVLGLGLWEAGPVVSTSGGNSSGISSGGSGICGLGLAVGASSSLLARRRDPDESFELDPRVLAALPPDAEAKRVYALRQRHRAGSLSGYAAWMALDDSGTSSGLAPSLSAVYNTAWSAGASGGWNSGSVAGGGGGIEAWEREREREGLKARELGDLLRLKLGLDERGVWVEGAAAAEAMGVVATSSSLSSQALPHPHRASHGKPAIASMDQLVANMVLARQMDAARKKPARARTWSPPTLSGNKDPAASACTLTLSSPSNSPVPPIGNGQGADGALLPSPPPAKLAKTPRSPLRQVLLPDDIEEYVSDRNDVENLEEGGWRNLATLVESPGALSPLCLSSGIELR